LNHKEATVANENRALATIERIADLAPIPDADAIVRARVRGWDVVVKLDEFRVGDLCVYFEIDSFLDTADPRFAFLAPRGVKTDTTGKEGHALKTARLRGQYSQGLVLPWGEFPELAAYDEAGMDVTDVLGITQWEPPIPEEIADKVRGYMPGWIPKTGENRVQNVAGVLEVDTGDWVATEKIDGTSVTIYVDPYTPDGKPYRGVVTRQWDLTESDATVWGTVRKLGLHDLIEQTWPGRRVALQGELFGMGISQNPLRLRTVDLKLFNIIVEARWELLRPEWPQWALDLSVPERPELAFPRTVEEALADVEGLMSVINPERPAEGVVWRRQLERIVRMPDDGIEKASFKVVSNRYLLKNDR
jgi:RNA ligase (TIGR02306 family)